LVEARRLNVFQLLVQESADLLLVLSPYQPDTEEGGAVLFANPAAETLLVGRAGTADAEALLLGKGLLDFVHPEDREAVRGAFAQAAAVAAAASKAGGKKKQGGCGGGGGGGQAMAHQQEQQRIRCRLSRAAAAGEGEGEGQECELLIREGTQGLVCNGRLLL
jgi:hypothetical protein